MPSESNNKPSDQSPSNLISTQHQSPSKSVLQHQSPSKSTPQQQSESKSAAPPSTRDLPSLSALSEKRLRLARSLHLLQSDIRMAREGIETLETRLENIQDASTARQIDSERRITLRRINGDPLPVIDIPPPTTATTAGLRTGTYVWLPFTRGWIIFILWILVVIQTGILVIRSGGEGRRWEPYAFGDWGRDVKWPS